MHNIHFYQKNELKVKKEFIETVISSGAFSIHIYMTFIQFFSSSMYYMILQAFRFTYSKQVVILFLYASMYLLALSIELFFTHENFTSRISSCTIHTRCIISFCITMCVQLVEKKNKKQKNFYQCICIEVIHLKLKFSNILFVLNVFCVILKRTGSQFLIAF